ncbi:LysM peptidoglycan-binding domain-containing protein, partial [Pseudanabaenaceae cyanobacterium LEGE 13415]|nr:LysM peptidoglycan-binding domain-containing protein [Pseudanabaenaceae cyanobacterium LEGE 13415]
PSLLTLSGMGDVAQTISRLAEDAQFKKSLADARGTSDVRRYTDRLIALTEAKGDYGNPPRPPRCRVLWGAYGQLIEGVLLKLSIAFTRFSADGTPIRAKANCSFEEWQPSETSDKAKNLIDDPIRVVRRGETLSSIAAEEYNDPSLWRLIADVNQLENPRDIFPGQTLTVPPRP